VLLVMVFGGMADQPQQYVGMLAMMERRQRWCMALVHTAEAMRRQGIVKGMWASALTYLKPGDTVSVQAPACLGTSATDFWTKQGFTHFQGMGWTTVPDKETEVLHYVVEAM